MYKERPKIDAEQQWIETGKAFLALFIAEPEFARKAVEIATTISEAHSQACHYHSRVAASI